MGTATEQTEAARMMEILRNSFVIDGKLSAVMLDEPKVHL